MSKIRKSSIALAALVGAGGLFLSDHFSTTVPGPYLSRAEAVIGRPLTPRSVAGVARRTTRRAVAAGAIGYGAYAVGRYGYPYNYAYTNDSSSYPYSDYGSSYPNNYGYTNYGSNYPYSNYGYASYGSSYGSTDYGSSYPYNYGYSDTHRFPMSNLELWCFPPMCDRSRFDEKNAPQAAVPWAGQSLVQRSATPLRPRRFVGNAAQREQASEPGYFGPNAQPWITK